MNAAGRLGLYGVGVVVAFGAAFGIGSAVVPASAVDEWTAAAAGHEEMSMDPELSLDPTSTSEVDGFTVTLDGDLIVGESSELTASIVRDGDPVADLEPNGGTEGRIVALRDGTAVDVRVAAGDTAGPDIAFAAEAPTAGRYLLYLDFQVDGQVHTASFVVDAGYGQ